MSLYNIDESDTRYFYKGLCSVCLKEKNNIAKIADGRPRCKDCRHSAAHEEYKRQQTIRNNLYIGSKEHLYDIIKKLKNNEYLSEEDDTYLYKIGIT